MFSKLHKMLCFSLFGIILVTSGCSAGAQTARPAGSEVKLTLAAYTTPREAYRELIPIFQQQWQDQTGQKVVFEESYQGSGAQSRAVAEGFEADIVALSLEADVIRLEQAGLITHNWRATPFGGIVSTSVVAFAVRKGNPQNISDWADLSQPGLEILTPNPKTSGGAMWNILAMYGAVKRGYVEGYSPDDAGAREFMLALLNNVTVMDKAARDSIVNFEKGIGDVAITYENEVLVGQQAGQTYELVLPTSTIQIDNPIALVDTYVDRHGNREAAEAFIDFCLSPQAQKIFTRYGLRSPDPAVAQAAADTYPPIQDLFTIDYFDGWKEATPDFFGDNGIFFQVFAQVQNIHNE
ncbi:MAG: sulfate ABC transporter substrate-binding protein [Anaerolineales bacterium]|nr:sulfate ABC transporter substrate-binding protein [Anaerolineales bacterium]